MKIKKIIRIVLLIILGLFFVYGFIGAFIIDGAVKSNMIGYFLIYGILFAIVLLLTKENKNEKM